MEGHNTAQYLDGWFCPGRILCGIPRPAFFAAEGPGWGSNRWSQ